MLKSMTIAAAAGLLAAGVLSSPSAIAARFGVWGAALRTCQPRIFLQAEGRTPRAARLITLSPVCMGGAEVRATVTSTTVAVSAPSSGTTTAVTTDTTAAVDGCVRGPKRRGAAIGGGAMRIASTDP
jgi:hypothetical protein